MKVCPECKTTYDDDVETCEHDGAALIEPPDALPDNPELDDVLQVGASDATAMVDLEAMEDEIRERKRQKAEDDARAQEEAEEEARQEAIRNDPDATGVISLEEVEAQHRREREEKERSQQGSAERTDKGVPAAASLSMGSLSGVSIAADDDKDAPTAQVRRRKKDEAQPSSGAGKAVLVVLAVLFGMLIMTVLAFVGYRVLGPFGGQKVAIATWPEGAEAKVDGKDVGTTPTKAALSPGNHRLELRLEGYEPFKEVFSVKKGDKQPAISFDLVPLSGTVVPPKPGEAPAVVDAGAAPVAEAAPTADTDEPDKQRADELVADTRAAIADKDYDGAFGYIQELLKLAPDDPRTDELIDQLASAREEAEGEPAAAEPEGGADPEPSGTTSNTGNGSSERVAQNGNNGGRRTSGRRRGRMPSSTTAPTLPRSKEERRTMSRTAYTEGERLYRLGQFKDAKLMFSRAIQLDPRFAQPHRSLGRIYNREGNNRKVRYHLARYIRLGGPDPDRKVRRWLEENKK